MLSNTQLDLTSPINLKATQVVDDLEKKLDVELNFDELIQNNLDELNLDPAKLKQLPEAVGQWIAQIDESTIDLSSVEATLQQTKNLQSDMIEVELDDVLPPSIQEALNEINGQTQALPDELRQLLGLQAQSTLETPQGTEEILSEEPDPLTAPFLHVSEASQAPIVSNPIQVGVAKPQPTQVNSKTQPTLQMNPATQGDVEPAQANVADLDKPIEKSTPTLANQSSIAVKDDGLKLSEKLAQLDISKDFFEQHASKTKFLETQTNSGNNQQQSFQQMPQDGRLFGLQASPQQANPSIHSTSFNQLLSGAKEAPVTGADTPIHVHQQNWGKVLSERLVMMAQRGSQQAYIQIDPAELGPIEVSIRIDSDGANMHFTSQHGQIRDLIENQMNQLRQDFQAEGMNLVDVSVSDQRADAQDHPLSQQANRPELPELSQPSQRPNNDNLLDIFV